MLCPSAGIKNIFVSDICRASWCQGQCCIVLALPSKATAPTAALANRLSALSVAATFRGTCQLVSVQGLALNSDTGLA